MDEIRIKMSEMCDIIGITPQGVRLYENYNAIPHYSLEGTNYRYFYFDNIGTSVSVRSFRKMGFLLPTAAKLAVGSSVEEISAGLALREQELINEIKRQEAILHNCQEMAEMIKTIEEKAYQFHYCVRPAMYHLVYEEDGELLKKKTDKKLIRSWSEQYPFVRFCPLVDYVNLGANTRSKIAFCVLEKDVALVGDIIKHQRVKYLPGCKCIGGIISVSRDTLDYYSVVEQGIAYLKENNLELVGDMLTLMLASGIISSDGKAITADYYYVWYPIK